MRKLAHHLICSLCIMTLYWNQLSASCTQLSGDSVADQKIQDIDKELDNLSGQTTIQKGLVQKLAADIRTLETKLAADKIKLRYDQINQAQIDNTKTQLANAKENKEIAKTELDRLTALKLSLVREKNNIRIQEQKTQFGDDFQYYDLMMTASETNEDKLSLETKAIAVAGMELECVVLSDVVPASYDLFKAASHSYIAEEINAIAEFRAISADSQCSTAYDKGEREKQYESLLRSYNHKKNQLAAAERKLANAEMARDMYRPVYDETVKEYSDKEGRLAEAKAWVKTAEKRVEAGERWVERSEKRVADAKAALEKAKSEKGAATGGRIMKFIMMMAALAAAIAASGTPAGPAKWALYAAAVVLFMMAMMGESAAQDSLNGAEAELKAALEELELAEEELALAEQELDEGLFELDMANIHTHLECRRNPMGSAFTHPFYFDRQINDSILKITRNTKSEQTAKMVTADYLRMLSGARSSRPYNSTEPNLKELEKGLDSFGLMLRKKTVKTIKLATNFFFPEANALVTMVTCDNDIKRCADGTELGRQQTLNCHFPRCPTIATNARSRTGNGAEDCPTDKRQCADGTYVTRDPAALNKCSFDICQPYIPSEDSRNDDRKTDTRVSRGFGDGGVCTAAYNPVCAIPNSLSNRNPVQTYQNECLAREKDASIQYYGECTEGTVGNGTAQFVDDITKDLNLAVGTKAKDYFDRKKNEHIRRQVIAWEEPKTRMEYMAEVVAIFDNYANTQMPKMVAEAMKQVAEYDLLIKQFDLQTITNTAGYDSYNMPGACYVQFNGDVNIDPTCECLKTSSCYKINPPTSSGYVSNSGGQVSSPGIISSSGSFIVGVSNALSEGNIVEARSQVQQLQANLALNGSISENVLSASSPQVREAVAKAVERGKLKADEISRLGFGGGANIADSPVRAVGSDYADLFNKLGGSSKGKVNLESEPFESASISTTFKFGDSKAIGIGGKKDLEEKSSSSTSKRSTASSYNEDYSEKGYDPKTTVINKDRDTSIFQVISSRYKKSAFPVLLRYVETKK